MQRNVSWGKIALVFCVALFCLSRYAAAGTLRIVEWNIEDDIDGNTTPLPGFNTVLQGIGNETIGSDPAQPLDILALEETTSNTTTVQPILNDLNGDYAGANYKMSTYQATQDGTDTADGNGPNAIVYNANKLNLLASFGVVTPTGTGNGGNGVDRQPVRYEFQPVGDTGSTGIFYVYVSHSKSGSTSADLTAQNEEATIIRNDEATNLPSNASVIYSGDLNDDPNDTSTYNQQFKTYESATATNTKTGTTVTQGGATDPANASTSAAYLSESSTDLRYRDDYQLITANVAGGTGAINYVAGSFHYLGNNGSVASGGNIENSTALAYMTTAAGYNPTGSQVLSALTTASDHLPAIADYTYATPEPGSCSLAGGDLPPRRDSFGLSTS
jgi:hypothetical protein